MQTPKQLSGQPQNTIIWEAAWARKGQKLRLLHQGWHTLYEFIELPHEFLSSFSFISCFFLKHQEVGHRKSEAAAEAEIDSCCCFRHHHPSQGLWASAGQEFPPLLCYAVLRSETSYTYQCWFSQAGWTQGQCGSVLRCPSPFWFWKYLGDFGEQDSRSFFVQKSMPKRVKVGGGGGREKKSNTKTEIEKNEIE